MSRRPIYLLPLSMLCLCLCSSFLLSIAFSPKAFAFSNPITISYSTDSVHFPSYIDFTMTASDSNAPISQATFYITFKDTPDALAEQHNVTVTPGRSVTLHWREATDSSDFHSPGTPVEYYWELRDSSNNQYTEAPQDFTTTDTRFSWLHQSQGLLQVNWYNRPNNFDSQNFGSQVLDKANTDIQEISQKLGGGLLHPINLWVYASNEDFHGALAPNSYEWVGGEAHPYLNEAFISVTDSQDLTLIRDMPHELTHLVFHQLIAQGPLAPTWFDEGLAVYNQSYQEPEMGFRFQQALISHTLLRLNLVSNGFPADADKAYLAYAQSWNLVAYMYSTFGEAKMSLLIKKMNDPQTDFGEDLTQALGLDQVHLENQWRLHLNQPSILSSDQLTPGPASSIQPSQAQSTPTDTTAPLFMTLGALLILLPMLGIVAIFLYSRRRRQQALAVQSAQHILAPSGPSGQPNYPIQYPNTSWQMPPGINPASPPQQYPPFSYSGAEQAPGGPSANAPFFLPQTPVPPPNTPGIVWQTDYPARPSEDGANNGLPLVGPFQENIHQQPGGKAPQE